MKQLLPVILTLVVTFVTVVGVKAFLGVTFGGMFLALGSFVMPPHSQEKSSGDVVAGPVKVKWQGVASTGLLVAGVLMLVLALLAYLDSHEVL